MKYGICGFHLFLTEAICAAIEQLDVLGAVERKDDQVTLTPLGKKMASFPLEPRFAKVRKGIWTSLITSL